MAEIKEQAELRQFFTQFPQKKLQPQELLLPIDQVPQHIIYLEDGYVRQYAVSDEGDEFTFNYFKPNTFFPLNLILHHRSNPYYFTGASQGIYREAPREQVLDFLQSNPKILFHLLIRITSGINGMLLRLESLVFGDARAKVAAAVYLSYLRFGQKSQGEEICEQEQPGTVIKLELSHELIAYLTGLTRESVSSEMIKLKKEGLINYRRKKICVLQPQKLKEISSLPFYA